MLFVQVDMTALLHMADEDLKALGIPMVNFYCFSWLISLGTSLLDIELLL